MQTRVVLYFCALGIVSAAVNDWTARQNLYRKNAFFNRQPEVTVLPRKWGVFPSTTPKTFPKNSYVTSAVPSFSTANPIVVSDTPFKSVFGNQNQKVQFPAPTNFSRFVPAPTTQRPTTEKSVTILTEKPPVPVPVKIPGNDFFPIVSTPKPFVPSPTEKVPTSENEFKNPFNVVSSSFRLWPKLPEPVPVPVLADKSFIDQFKDQNGAFVGPQYIKKPPVPNPPQAVPIPVQYPQNQPRPQIGQTPNQGSYYLILSNGNNLDKYNPGIYQPNPTQAPIPSQPQRGNQNFIILGPVGGNSQNSFPNQYQNGQYQNSFSNQGYNINQQNQQPSPNYAFLVSSPNGQQTQQGQQPPLTYIILGANGAPIQPQNPANPQSGQAPPSYLFGTQNGNQANANQNYAYQIQQNQAPGQQNQPILIAIQAPNTAPGSPPYSQSPNNGYSPNQYPYQSDQSSPQYSSQSGQPIYYQPGSQQGFDASTPSSQQPQYFIVSSTPPPAQSNYYQSQSQSPYTGFSSTPNPSAQPIYYQPSQFESSTAAPAGLQNYYQSTASPQFASSTANQQQYYQSTASPQFASSTPSQQQYYQSTASPQFASSTANQQQYYQSTASPQFDASTASPADQQYYQSTAAPQYASTPSPVPQDYYQSTSSPLYDSSTAAPSAQPNVYQPPQPQYSVAPDGQSYYQSTAAPQGVQYSSTPSTPTSRVRFSSDAGSYSYFV